MRSTLPLAAALLPLAVATAADPVARLAVDWPAHATRQDPVWNRMPAGYYEGPFVGNGLVGTVLFQEPETAGTVRFELGRTDVYDHRPGMAAHYRCRLPIGQLLLTPVGKITATRLRTDLWNAEVTGTLTTDQGSIALRCFAPSGAEVLVLELAATGGETTAQVSLRPQQADSPRWLAQPKRDKNFTYVPNPPFTVATQDGVEVVTQPLAAGSDYATAWSIREDAPGKRTVLVSLANRRGWGKTPATGSAADALANLAAARTQGTPALEAVHRAWWHAYYPASFVTVPDARIESFYFQQLYKMASATRPARPEVDLMGPWFKVTVWPSYWQNLNTQLAYYTTDVTNHSDFNEPKSRLLEERTADLIANVPKEWQSDSAALGNPTGFGELVASAPGPATLKKGQHYNYLCLPWLVQQHYLHARYTSDDARLRDKVYPLLVRSMNTYLRTLVKDGAGIWHIPLAFSDEYGKAEDTNMNLAILRWGLETLLAEGERLAIAHPDRAKWKEVMDHLVDYPVDPETGYMIGKDMPFAKSHRHSSHLFAIYPFQVLHPEDRPESRAVIERSLRHFTGLVGDECLFKFTATSSLWATIGNGDEALTWLNRSLNILPTGPTIGPNTLYSENGWPTFESPISGARSLTDMLIQCRRGVIHVLPAVPAAWPAVAFNNLRAEGAFLISAARRQGRTAFVQVQSLAGEPCRVKTDLAAPVKILGRPGTLTADVRGVYTLPLAKGETVVLVSGDQVPDLTIAPLPVEGSHGWGLP